MKTMNIHINEVPKKRGKLFCANIIEKSAILSSMKNFILFPGFKNGPLV